LAQRCLAAHSALTSFPETNFLNKAFGGRHGQLRRRFGLMRGDRRRRAFRQLAERLERPDLAAIGERSLRPKDAVRWFSAALDDVAAGRGADGWIEKTPKHFRYIDLLEQAVPGVRFIHLVRDGRDVVASLVDRARQFPDREGFAKQRDPAVAATLWKEAINVVARCQGRPNHLVVAYENLVGAPERELRRVCEWLGEAFEPAMLESSDVATFVRPDESWKAGAAGPIAPSASKFETTLSVREREVAQRHLELGRYADLLPEGSGTGLERAPAAPANALK